MGIYLNPGCELFSSILDDSYIDKSKLIRYTNSVIGTSHKLICFTEPRRFGKTYAAKMLCAYYDMSCDSSALFETLAIKRTKSFPEYINKYNVIYLDITGIISEIVSTEGNIDTLVELLISKLRKELVAEWQLLDENLSIGELLYHAVNASGRKFVFIIDEWDAIFRETPSNEALQEKYMNFLRGIFKNANITDKTIALAYMTGILPIKKYGHQSAISDFDEYSMTNFGNLTDYVGFSEKEVRRLARKSDISYEDLSHWYDGYYFENGAHIFNPISIIKAIDRKKIDSYWGKTETYEQLKDYIDLNYSGMRDDIIRMLAQERVSVDVDSFQNDLTSIKSKDDVYTLLVHLGYLTYDLNTKTVSIPNFELMLEFKRAVLGSSHEKLREIIKKSEDVFKATINLDEKKVAELVHYFHTKLYESKHYNSEEALRAVVRAAYFSCIDSFIRIEELPSGEGYIDLAYLPKVDIGMDAMVIELKWNKTAEGAIKQIKDKKYPEIFESYRSNLILVGINYSKDDKKHECKIERIAI